MASFGQRLKCGKVLIVLLGITGLLAAQQPAGEIRLEVKDPSGAAVQATGTLQNATGGAARTFKTDAQGVYTAKDLAQGRYRLEISKTGFATQAIQVDVAPGTPVSRTVTLELSSETASVNVVSIAPLPGSTMSKDDVPMALQTLTAKDLEESGALDLSDFMNRRMTGVYVNNNQENPFQPDLNYRGYTASPLLGTPEGLSVYVDGVRQNQPFGDVVAWDLIPKNAISEMTLIPGSDPLFGLNTLGGALSVKTKDGVSNPGLAGTLTDGSSGRKAVDAEYGGSKATGFNWYVSGLGFHETGWRFDSPSDVRQVFGKLGYVKGKTDGAFAGVRVCLQHADGQWNSRTTRFLAANYTAVNTVPDSIADRSPSLTLNLIAMHTFSSFNLFPAMRHTFRYVRADTTNGDLNDDSFGESVYQPQRDGYRGTDESGLYTGFPLTAAPMPTTEPFPFWRCIAQGLEFSEPTEKCDGLIVYSKEV